MRQAQLIQALPHGHTPPFHAQAPSLVRLAGAKHTWTGSGLLWMPIRFKYIWVISSARINCITSILGFEPAGRLGPAPGLGFTKPHCHR